MLFVLNIMQFPTSAGFICYPYHKFLTWISCLNRYSRSCSLLRNQAWSLFPPIYFIFSTEWSNSNRQQRQWKAKWSRNQIKSCWNPCFKMFSDLRLDQRQIGFILLKQFNSSFPHSLINMTKSWYHHEAVLPLPTPLRLS